MNDPDDSRVWKAIDWKGQFSHQGTNNNSPSDAEFKEFYEGNLNQYSNDSHVCDLSNCISVPVLDSPITSVEVNTQIIKMKANKSYGLDGIYPGVYKMLTPQWILLITTLFNLILSSASYPISWSRTKLFMLFTRGNRKDPFMNITKFA